MWEIPDTSQSSCLERVLEDLIHPRGNLPSVSGGNYSEIATLHKPE